MDEAAMFSQKACEKSAGSTPESAQPPTPSATPKAKDEGDDGVGSFIAEMK